MTLGSSTVNSQAFGTMETNFTLCWGDEEAGRIVIIKYLYKKLKLILIIFTMS